MRMMLILTAALSSAALISCATPPEAKPPVTKIELTEEYIPEGADIDGKGAVATATAWSEQYHDLATTYNILRGWVIGVKDGQQGIDAPPVQSKKGDR